MVGGVLHRRVDDQWPGGVVGTGLECHRPAAAQDEASGDAPPGAARHLEHRRPPVKEQTSAGPHAEVSLAIDLHGPRALEAQADHLGIDARRHHEVVPESAFGGLPPVEVHAGIQPPNDHTPEVGHVGHPPLRVPSEEVVTHPLEPLPAGDPGLRARAAEAHAHDFGRRCLAPGSIHEDHVLRGEERGVAGAPGEESHRGIRLPPVGLEVERGAHRATRCPSRAIRRTETGRNRQ